MNINYLKYKYRFFLGYIIIGISSLILELLIFNFIIEIYQKQIIVSLGSVVIGILLSFWLNTRYNFKISNAKRNRALKYYLQISIFSYLLQISFINLISEYMSYEYARIIISGSLFWLAYLLHVKFSFKDYKKVGVAIYANGVEDLNKIFNNVKMCPDFIHIDVVDKTVNIEAEDVLSYKTEVIRAFWNTKFIEAHIMSKNPSKWIEKIKNDVDRIYFHVDIEENIKEVLETIKESNCEVGIVIQNLCQIKFWEDYNNLIDSILVLSIKNPGFSGQNFEMDSINIIEKINNHPLRKKISLNVDGGVNNLNIPLIKSENVVSGSYVLSSKDPIKNIMILQTSSQYEPI